MGRLSSPFQGAGAAPSFELEPWAASWGSASRIRPFTAQQKLWTINPCTQGHFIGAEGWGQAAASEATPQPKPASPGFAHRETEAESSSTATPAWGCAAPHSQPHRSQRTLSSGGLNSAQLHPNWTQTVALEPCAIAASSLQTAAPALLRGPAQVKKLWLILTKQEEPFGGMQPLHPHPLPRGCEITESEQRRPSEHAWLSHTALPAHPGSSAQAAPL